MLLPYCAHYSHPHKSFGKYEEEFVPGALAVNRARKVSEREQGIIELAFLAAVKFRSRLGRGHIAEYPLGQVELHIPILGNHSR